MQNHKLQLYKCIFTDKMRKRRLKLRQFLSVYTCRCTRVLLLGTRQNQMPRPEWMVFFILNEVKKNIKER
jgi:hypothetical protein